MHDFLLFLEAILPHVHPLTIEHPCRMRMKLDIVPALENCLRSRTNSGSRFRSYGS
jgi:hypothetical protein